MKHPYTFLAGLTIILMSSCSSSRNAAQTPDDIYYSPAGTRVAAAGSSANQGEYYSAAPSDQYVRMRVQDPQRWSYFDDYNAYDSYYAPASMGYGAGFGYGYPAYGFGYGLGFGPSFGFGFGDPYMCWNSYFMWNSWYNPYFYNPYYGGGVLVYSHQVAAPYVYSHLRSFNSNGYSNGIVKNVNNLSPSGRGRLFRPGMTSTTNYNSNLGNGNATRRVVTGNGNGNSGNSFYRPGSNNNNNSGSFRPAFNNTSSQPVRSFSPASSGGSSSGGGGGGFGRPGRH